jgi:hypothetical protein
MEQDRDQLALNAARARRLADAATDALTRQRLMAAAEEFEQRAADIRSDKPSNGSKDQVKSKGELFKDRDESEIS